jgi:PilZ domain
MADHIDEPQNRPKERIEKLISNPSNAADKRIHKRLAVEPGTEVFFPIICRGEVMDVSESGLSVRFKPLEAPSLEQDETISMTMKLAKHSFLIPAEVKRVEARFGVIVLGMEFDPKDVEIDA